jgi:hypothetical protein
VVTGCPTLEVAPAKRLAQENDVDLSPFHGVIVIVNALVEDSALGHDMVISEGDRWGQTKWRGCKKCQGLAYAGGSSPGACPAGDVHDHSDRIGYGLAVDDSSFPGQNNWRWCNKCQGLAYAGGSSPGACPADDVHDHSGSGNYTLGWGKVRFAGQNNWRWCNKCQGLIFTGAAICPAGDVHDHSGSGNYTITMNDSSFPGQPEWKWCKKCQGLAYAGGSSPGACPAGDVHDHSGSGNYTITKDNPSFPGQPEWKWCKKCQGLCYNIAGNPPCPAGGIHNHSGSADYTLAFSFPTKDMTFYAHESGHCLGLAHSWSANPDEEYGDQFDIMGGSLRSHNFSPYPPAGPGLNAPTLYKLGWLKDERVFTWHVSPSIGDSRVKLVALNAPEIGGYLMAMVVTPAHVYTVEFRQPKGWDQGISPATILIHELRSNYTTGQNNWRWCNKCQGLIFTGAAICPAGDVHDHSGSADYALAVDDSSFPGQNNWRWCNKCQGLAYAGGSSPGACPADDVHDHSGSANYTLANFGQDKTYLIGSFNAGEIFKDDKRNVRISVDSIDSGSSTATITIHTS